MTTVPVTVQPGRPQCLNQNMPADTLIYNTDQNNGVWISSAPSMTAGYGMYVGPKGVTVWSAAGAAYAIVDIGVNSPVSLAITDDVSQISNPTDIALANAAALAQSGIPGTVYESTLTPLPNQTFTMNNIAAGGTLAVDVSKYSSVTLGFVRKLLGGGGFEAGYAVACQFDDLTGGGVGRGERLILSTMEMINAHGPGVSLDVSWTFPVTSGVMHIGAGTGKACSMWGFGSNRVVTGLAPFNKGVRRFYDATNFTLNTSLVIPPADDTGMGTGDGAVMEYFKGPCKANIAVATTGIGGNFGYVYTRLDGQVETVILNSGQAAGTRVMLNDVAMPSDAVHFFFMSTTAGTVAGTVEIQVIPC